MSIRVLSLIGLIGLTWAFPALSAESPGTVSSSYDQKPLVGAHHRVRTVPKASSKQSGAGNSDLEYIELQTGLHYWQNGAWQRSKEEIDLRTQHAVAYRSGHRVIFQANLNRLGAVEFIHTSGQTFRTHVVGLSYFDSASGKSVLISDLKNSLGELIPPNQMVYKDAFTDIKADVRYTYTKAGLEQDVILRELPPAPESWGLDPTTTRLEVLTEFLAPPEPVVTSKKFKQEKDAKVRAKMTEPDWIDETLDFGSLLVGPGRAFSINGSEPEPTISDPSSPKGARAGPPAGRPTVAVGKRWLKMEGRQFLVETVEYAGLKAAMPGVPGQAKPRKSEVTLLRTVPPMKPSSIDPASERIELARLPYRPTGLVLDYYMVKTTPNFTFRSGRTYHVDGEVFLNGTTSIEKGAVIKFGPKSSLRVLGPLESPSAPAYLTAQSDGSVGVALPERLPAAGSGAPAVGLYNVPHGTVIKNLDIRYAVVGIQDHSPEAIHRIENCRFFKCQTAVEAFGAAVTVDSPRLEFVETIQRALGEGKIEVTRPITTRSSGSKNTQNKSQSVKLLLNDDYGDTRETASWIGSNTSISGYLDYGGDIDYFAVYVSGPGTLNAYTTGYTDTFGTLENAWGGALTYSDDNPYPNFNFSYNVSQGTYYIKVNHYGWWGSGPYTLNVQFTAAVSDDHGNSTASATWLSLNSSIYGNIDYGGDEDFFRVDVYASGSLGAYTTGSTDTYGYLLDAWGNTLTSNDDNPYPNFNFNYSVSPGTYYIRVRHYWSSGTGSYVLTANFSPSMPPPGTPAGLAASAYVGYVYLSWSSAYAATSYNIKRSTSAYGPFSTVGSMSSTYYYDWSGLSAGTTYYYVVSAVNSAGESGDSGMVSAATAPDPPTGLTASSGNGYVYLNWSGASGSTMYRVKRSTTSGGSYSSIGDTAYNYFYDYGVSPSTTYYYVVSGISATGAEGNYSGQASATTPAAMPSPPASLSASGGNTSVSLTWSSSSGATTYNLKRSSASGGPYATILSTSGTSFTDTGLGYNSTYYYVVSAANSSGESGNSGQASATTAPAAPASLSVSPGNGQITLSWSGSDGASSYRVYRSTSSGGPFSQITSISSTGFTDTGLAAGTIYYYFVSAVNLASTEGSGSSVASGTTAPPAPANVSAGGGNGYVSLSWSSATAATSYTVKRATQSGGPYTAIISTSSTSDTDYGLAVNTTYYYVVSASNSAGESSNSSQAGATTAPAPPSGVSASPSTTQVTLSWSLVSGASSYRVKRATSSGGPYTLVGSPISPSYIDTGLSSGTTYYYAISAVNSFGLEGSNSSPVAATTTSADSDGDGLPDSWELQYFGTLSQNQNGDFDGDGLTNLQEYQSGTNPADLRVRIARPVNGTNVF